MNTVREIEQLNKRELEDGVSVTSFPIRKGPSVNVSKVHPMLPGMQTIATQPTSTSVDYLLISPKAMSSPSSLNSANPSM